MTDFHNPDTSSSGGGFPGAIVGANPVPYAFAVLAQNDILETDDISAEDPLNLGFLTGITIEFWFQLAGSAPAGNRVIFQGPRSSTVGVAQWYFTLTTAGAIQFTVTDETGTQRTASGSTNLVPLGWTHIVGSTVAGASSSIYINGTAEGSTAWGAHSVQTLGAVAAAEDLQFNGPPAGGTNYDIDSVAIYRTSLSQARITEHYNAGVNMGLNTQTTTDRMNSVLDEISSPTVRSIGSSSRQVIPTYFSGQAPIEELRQAVEAEDVDAGLFITRSGAIKFLPDGHRASSPYDTVQATFGDAGGSELPYLDLAVDYSLTYLVNEWKVTRSLAYATTPVTQTASDATSISQYFKRSQSLSDVPCALDSDASTIATRLLAKHKDPFYMFTSITPNMVDPATADAVYALDLMDRIEIRWTPPGGGSRITQQVFINRISHSGESGQPPKVELAVSPL